LDKNIRNIQKVAKNQTKLVLRESITSVKASVPQSGYNH